MEINNFFGNKNIIFWMGTITNRSDPLTLGRCQVRIFGHHTDNQALLPDADLPWALPMYPVNAASTYSKPKLNDWVFGFFLDGDSAQAPVMMGIIPGLKPSK